MCLIQSKCLYNKFIIYYIFALRIFQRILTFNSNDIYLKKYAGNNIYYKYIFSIISYKVGKLLIEVKIIQSNIKRL